MFSPYNVTVRKLYNWKRALLLFSFFLYHSDLFCLSILSVEGYCCTWPHSVIRHTQTHTFSIFFLLGRTTLEGGRARRRILYLRKTQYSHKKDIHAAPGFETRNPKNRATADLRVFYFVFFPQFLYISSVARKWWKRLRVRETHAYITATPVK
jgi:hypothetical protein